MSSPKALTIEQLKHALHLAGEVARLQAEIHAILGTDHAVPNVSTSLAVSRPKKGKRSAAVRARMAAAQKARWAKSKAGTSTPVIAAKPAKKKGKRTMSVEARAKIAAAQKARWAKSKGAKAPTVAVISKIAKIEAKAPKTKKAKRNISLEVRAKMAEPAKRRWAKVKQTS